MRDLPDHPVARLIRDSASYGQPAVPSAAELAALDLSADQRERVEWACREAARLRDGGSRATALGAAEVAAGEIVNDLSPEQRDPASWREAARDRLSDLDPRKLAENLPRHF